MSVLNLLAGNNFLVVNKDLMKMLGLESAVMLGELASEYVYWEAQGKLDNGFFYSTVENVENNTTLTGYQQREALKKLKELGLVEIERKGIPAKRYIKVCEQQVVKIFNNCMSKNFTTGNENFKELDVENFDTNNNNINNNNLKNNKTNNKEKDIVSQSDTSVVGKQKAPLDYQEYIDTYNMYCTKLPKVKVLTDKRKKQIKALSTKIDLEEFKEICSLTNENEFLTGNNDRGWQADFDFVTRLDKAVTILEGGYKSTKEPVIENGFAKLQEMLEEERSKQYEQNGNN